MLALLIALAFGPGMSSLSTDSLRSLHINDSVVRFDTVPDEELLKNDFAFGATIGTPGGLNLVTQWYYDRIGLRAEAGAAIFLAGYQGSVSYVITRNARALLELSAIFMRNNPSTMEGSRGWNTGIGLGAAVNAGGLFFEFGMGHLWSDNAHPTLSDLVRDPLNKPDLTVQFGYVH